WVFSLQRLGGAVFWSDVWREARASRTSRGYRMAAPADRRGGYHGRTRRADDLAVDVGALPRPWIVAWPFEQDLLRRDGASGGDDRGLFSGVRYQNDPRLGCDRNHQRC